MNNPSTGLDADGFILTVADTPVQREYQPLLAKICQCISNGFGRPVTSRWR